FKIREPNDTTELTLVDNQPNGAGGLTIIDNGDSTYTASYTYNPDDAQALGVYDLYFWVSDGTDTASDGYAANPDEFRIEEVIVNNPPTVVDSATSVSASQVNRLGANTTTISTVFSDADQPGVGGFTVTFKIREPNDTTELTLVDHQTNGSGGLVVSDLGAGSYKAEYNYDADDAQTLGLYDLYFQVSDGTDSTADSYASNPDELEIIEAIVNNPPTIVAGTTFVSPGSIDRVGAATTTFATYFSDADSPGVNGFYLTFKARAPYSQATYVIADSLQNGQGSLTVADSGGGDYYASIAWDPPDNAVLGYYDLYCMVADVEDTVTDGYSNNPDELLLTNGGENSPPVVASDATVASPAAVERIGANSTTVSATFVDGDSPGIGAFSVSFKLRLPDNTTELVLANQAGHGTGGVTIADGGGGVYTASIDWDPPDGQTLGYYDLYFDVNDGTDTSLDAYQNNLDELEVFDAVSNNAPTIVAGTTFVTPDSISRLGSEYTMIKSAFSDADVEGVGAFAVTIKVRDQSSTEYTIVDSAYNREQGLRVRHGSGPDYEASVLWDPPVGQVTGTYDLYIYVRDGSGDTASDSYASNADELTVSAAVILGDGNLLKRTNDAAGCGDSANACHDVANHQSQDCRVCHTPHQTKNIYLIRDSIQTPVDGLKEVIFKTLGMGDPYNDPDPTEGNDTHGAMADDSNSVQTEICEVCHDSTKYYRNDDSHTNRAHHNIENCVDVCHPHTAGFLPAGGGESEGGQACSCHSSIFSPMNTSTLTYHHQLNSDSASYNVASRTCLMCHVDHDIFRSDLNTGFGQPARNLRADTSSTVVQGSSTVLANSDYSSSGAGGICLSCHTSSQTKGYTQPDSTTQTPVLPKADFDAATSSHNYNVPSTFSGGSTFNANCVKCHNDNMTKSYQTSTEKFSVHSSDYRRILAPLGVASPSDPLEEDFCFQCHSTTDNPNAGTNQDYYGVKAMTDSALAIKKVFGYTYTHPTVDYSGLHQPIEDSTDLADGNRHAECADCHNPHAAQQGTHDGSSNLVSN
ncbi:MAG: hypothetical protein ACYS21_08155, partial [Planctomycetota bacterium]